MNFLCLIISLNGFGIILGLYGIAKAIERLGKENRP